MLCLLWENIVKNIVLYFRNIWHLVFFCRGIGNLNSTEGSSREWLMFGTVALDFDGAFPKFIHLPVSVWSAKLTVIMHHSEALQPSTSLNAVFTKIWIISWRSFLVQYHALPIGFTGNTIHLSALTLESVAFICVRFVCYVNTRKRLVYFIFVCFSWHILK